jgi:tRNA (mo5U34)-methyltransferase
MSCNDLLGKKMRTEPPANFDVRTLDQFYWHLGWEIFPGVRTPGRSPVELLLENAGVPKDCAGLRIADIGAWNGCVAFECERRGASEVVAISLEDPQATGFNFLKEILQTQRTRYELGTIYNLDPERIGQFDVVICFGVIYHLRYPILGIDNLRRIAKGRLYLESHVLDEALLLDGREISLRSKYPELANASLLQFYKNDDLAGDRSNWFSPSVASLIGLVESAGFEVRQVRQFAERGYVSAEVTSGMPPFLEKTYEGAAYDACLRPLYGPMAQWKR